MYFEFSLTLFCNFNHQHFSVFVIFYLQLLSSIIFFSNNYQVHFVWFTIFVMNFKPYFAYVIYWYFSGKYYDKWVVKSYGWEIKEKRILRKVKSIFLISLLSENFKQDWLIESFKWGYWRKFMLKRMERV